MKKIKKGYQKNPTRDIKIFLKKKKKNSNNMLYKNLSEDEKQKLVE